VIGAKRPKQILANFLQGAIFGQERSPDSYGWKRANQHFEVLRRTEVHHRSGIFGSSDFFGNVDDGGNVNTLYLQYHNTGQACPGKAGYTVCAGIRQPVNRLYPNWKWYPAGSYILKF
jgi:hypothetical protein